MIRSWWRNCALETDTEISAIDDMEDRIAPLAEDPVKIRELISSLELCHHKAERWVRNIIEAIGAGRTNKGLGTRSSGRLHHAERVWQSACAALSEWVAGSPAASVNIAVGSVPASRLLARLGKRSALKEWQVQRVVEKIRSTIDWPRSEEDPSARYVWLLLGGDEYESTYREHCPEHYKKHEDFWLKTIRTMIRDMVSGDETALSLGLAIDMLWPCHWRFTANLAIVLDAIGGKLDPEEPFAACGRNITMLPIQRRMEIVSGTLRVFCGAVGSDHAIDNDILALLGEPADVKKWLAASLDKTIRLQLNLPAEMRNASALTGPDWIQR